MSQVSQGSGVGTGGELTSTEESFVQNLAGLPFSAGDILYYSGTSLSRLPVGSSGYVLTISSNLPAWAASSFMSSEYAEDSLHVTGASGNFILGVRNDAGGGLTLGNGSYSPIAVDSAGRVGIADLGGSITIDGTVTASISASATTIAKAEDVASADADVGVPAMAIRKATPANTSGTDGDYEMLQMANGRLWTSSTIDAALPAGTNAIGKLASNSGITIGAVEIATAQTLATVTTVGTLTTITNVVHVDDNNGSLTVDGTVTASNTAGDVAHDGVDSGNPVKIGYQARQTNPTAVANADRVNGIADDIGRQVIVLNQVRDLVVQQNTQIVSSSAETTILTAGAAGVFHDITTLVLSNQSAGTATVVSIKDATAGTTRFTYKLGPLLSLSFPVPFTQTTAANNWTATLDSAAVTVDIFVQAIKNV